MSRMIAISAAVVLVVAGWTSFSGLPGNIPAPALRADGSAQRIGNGTVRTYVLYDPANRSVPIEVGIALSAKALENLPAPMTGHGATDAMSSHFDTHERLLAMPEQNPTPYKFIQFNWNPGGHEPPGVWDAPHFDFHFWTVGNDVRESIVPENSEFAAKGGRLPAEQYRSQFYVDAMTAAHAPAPAVTVPKMGLHWLDVRSPELQGLVGHPERAQKFTKTYIYGSWDGKFVFDEPMITREYLAAKLTADAANRDELIEMPTPARREVAGYYPRAYRISYDPETKEYRVALTRLTWQQ
jgi:uncharacterized protein